MILPTLGGGIQVNPLSRKPLSRQEKLRSLPVTVSRLVQAHDSRLLSSILFLLFGFLGFLVCYNWP